MVKSSLCPWPKYPDQLWEKWEWPWVCVSSTYLSSQWIQTSPKSFFFPSSTFPSLCWGVGICQNLQFLRLQIACSSCFLILQVETREIPIQYKVENLQNVRSNTGTSCPESLYNRRPWRNSKLAWARPWAAGSWLWGWPYSERGLDQATSRCPFQPTAL